MNTFTKQFKKIDLKMHGVRLPAFKIEDSYKKELGLSEDTDNLKFLKALCRENLKRFDFKEEKPKYLKRANHELKILKELGFVDYILLVWDVVKFCEESSIPIGLGRGSAAGSLVLYLIGVTHIDPVKYDLYFERFISKIRARKKVVDGVVYLDGSLMCDVDLDICYYNRHKVLKYLEEKFEGRTCKILTLNTLSSKLLIKECGKIAGGKTEVEMNEVSALIPKVYGQVHDLEDAYKKVKKFKEWCDENEKVYGTALRLRSLIKNKSVHPSGVLLSYDYIDKNVPTELTSDKNQVSSFDMNWASISNVKLDILGLRSVSVVYDACNRIGINPLNIDLNDYEKIYSHLDDLKTQHGLFQIEADANYGVCQKIKPKSLEQLSAVLALGRPGAMQFVDQYANYCNNDVYEPIHTLFDEILKSTGGVALYQEQLMQMAHKIGFTLDEAEVLRRIVGKKKVSEVKKWKKKINEKIEENRLSNEWTGSKGDVDAGEVLWKILEDSANYSFNKSHSLAYASLSAITIYLKFNHPKEFFLSLLKMTKHEPNPLEEVGKIQRELHAFGIKLLPPHIIKSELDFSVEGNDIRFGLLSVKGISDKTIEKLNNFRNEYSNKFEIFQAANEAGVSIGVLSALIQAGALEGFKQIRSKVVLEAQLWNLLTPREKLLVTPLGEENDYDLFAIVKFLNKTLNDKGVSQIKDSRLGTIKRNYIPYRDIYMQNSKNEDFANWYYERKLLGYNHGKGLNAIFKETKPNSITIREVFERPVNSLVTFTGFITEYYSGTSRKARKTKYLRYQISDETSFCTGLIFNDGQIQECRALNGGDVPQEEDIVMVRGVRKDDCVFIQEIKSQSHKIYTKLSDLKNKS